MSTPAELVHNYRIVDSVARDLCPGMMVDVLLDDPDAWAALCRFRRRGALAIGDAIQTLMSADVEMNYGIRREE